MKKYNHKKIEKYIQIYWKKNKTFFTNHNLKKKKFYCLSMFPYPSGSLHIGHIRNYTIGDIISRFYRMNNKNVLYPIGWDAFGLPAENAAINNKISPEKWTLYNINIMRKQLKKSGFSFDWDKEILTCNKNYYKWEQLFFKILYKNKIAYKKKSVVNWCNKDKTVLANEQVINDKCWRCNNFIRYKYIDQWFLKIKNYSNLLLNGLKKLKNWPSKIKLMQENWIGKTKYINVKFNLINFNNYIFYINFKNINDFLNIKYILITLKNNLSKKILKNIFKKKINNIYKNNINIHLKNKLYYNTNILLTNELLDKYIPILIVEKNYYIYIYKFIKEKNININDFLDFKRYYKYIKNNTLKNDNIKYYNKLYKYIYINDYIIKFKKEIFSIEYKNVNIFYKYNLKDWCISRQRYWGAQIPIGTLNNSKKIVTVPDKYIPIEPNYYNYKNNKLIIKIDNKNFIKLEKNTFDTFIQSSWYYIRYINPYYKKNIINKKLSKYWLPVDQYIGGSEHATMHLLYFRYYTRLLNKFKIINIKEPVKKLLCQGLVLSNSYYYLNKNNNIIWVSPRNTKIKYINNVKKIFDNKGNELVYNGLTKMSKSKNNGIDPMEIIEKYGADTLRMFIIFSSPAKSILIWNDNNIIGIKRFLNKLWNLIFNHINNKNLFLNKNIIHKEINIETYNCIKNITYDIKIKQSFNTSISNIMNLTNKLNIVVKTNKYNYFFIQEILSVLLRLLYPFAPHISFYLWNKIGYSNIDYSKWPDHNKYNIFKKKYDYIIQVNNKFKLKTFIDKKFIYNNLINYLEKNKDINIFFKNKKIINIKINKKIINILTN